VLGARAGRARYDQIMEKAKSLKNQAQERLGERPEWEGRASTSSTASADVAAPLERRTRMSWQLQRPI
jgi:hypothetical protein